MGYDMRITRAELWAANEGHEITRQERLSLVADDPDLTPDPDNGDEYALWDGECRCPEPWLRWWRGNIETKNPDRAIVAKMLEIAAKLRARVQGDDGEVYASPEEWSG